MTINNLPCCYNLDKIKIYRNNELLLDTYVRYGLPKNWEIDEELKSSQIESFTFGTDGCMSEILCLEIELKETAI